MTLGELIKIKESLEECKPDVEDFSWGPSWELAQRRKTEALKILKREIRSARDDEKEKT